MEDEAGVDADADGDSDVSDAAPVVDADVDEEPDTEDDGCGGCAIGRRSASAIHWSLILVLFCAGALRLWRSRT